MLIKRILLDQAALSLPNNADKVIALVYQVAADILNENPESHTLETKVALSIAIRLKAEELMIQKISDNAFWAAITSNQTIELIKEFKSKFPAETEAIKLFEQVNLMTPENIHLYSFMYEPILDLSAQHLTKLYGKLCAIK